LNVVINVKNYMPKKDDLIVYNGNEWVLMKKETILNDIYKQLKDDEAKIKLLEKDNKSLQDDIKKIAKVLKGEIEK